LAVRGQRNLAAETAEDLLGESYSPQAWLRFAIRTLRGGLMPYSRGSTGSLSKTNTPKTHSWTRRRGSLRTKRSGLRGCRTVVFSGRSSAQVEVVDLTHVRVDHRVSLGRQNSGARQPSSRSIGAEPLRRRAIVEEGSK
jgi:hypothetical protein